MRYLIELLFNKMQYVVFVCLIGLFHLPAYPQAEPVPLSRFETFNISGVVADAVNVDSLLPQLKSAAEESDEKFMNSFKQYIERFSSLDSNKAVRPAPKTRVTIKSGEVSRSTYTSEEGKFFFAGVPVGVYELSVEMPERLRLDEPFYQNVQSEIIIIKYPESNTKKNLFTYNVVVQLKVNLLTIQGRVLDEKGEPIANATVVAVQDPRQNANSDNSVAEEKRLSKWIGTSNENGYYEIHGIPAAGFEGLGYCKTSQIQLPADVIIIHAKKDGFAQDDNLIKVPLVSELQLSRGRTFLEIQNILLQRHGKPELKEDLGLKFPKSKGNTLFEVDLVLHRVEK